MKFVKGKTIVFSMIIINLLTTFAQVDPNCNYEQLMSDGLTYYITNNEYPNNYGRNVNCQWKATSPPNTLININCRDMSIPPSPDCTADRLIINTNGLDMTQGQNYCGYGELLLKSISNQVSFGLVSSSYSQGGRFQCSIEAVPKQLVCDEDWWQQRRIMGGVETGDNEYPFMAAIVILPQASIRCGATIISPIYALTAAHCLLGRSYNDLALLVGKHSGSESSDTKLMLLAGYKIHQDYDTDTYQNDIAIVETAKPIEFSLNVGPISLPFRYTTNTFAHQPLTLLGWGTDQGRLTGLRSGTKSDVLMAVNVTAITNTECQKMRQFRVNPSEICTFSENRDPCSIAPGGPAIWTDSGSQEPTLVGVVSFGDGCSAKDRDGHAFTRLSAYQKFIQEQLKQGRRDGCGRLRAKWKYAVSRNF